MDLADIALMSGVSDELKPVTKDRGTRYWSSIEIRSERWFQVETCEEIDGRNRMKSALANNFDSVVQLVHRFKRNGWTSVRIYTRLPMRGVDGYVFEIIKEVYKLDGSYYYLLKSGLMLRDDRYDGTGLNIAHLSDARRVYSVRPPRDGL